MTGPRLRADPTSNATRFAHPASHAVVRELPRQSVEGLLLADEAFLQALAVVRVEDADRAEFEIVYRATLTRLNESVGTNRSRWSELIYLTIGWVTHRRPATERSELFRIARDLTQDAVKREGVQHMLETGADQLLAEGKLEGSVVQTRKLILRLASKHLGTPDTQVVAALNAIEHLDRLERIHEHAKTWSELLSIE